MLPSFRNLNAKDLLQGIKFPIANLTEMMTDAVACFTFTTNIFTGHTISTAVPHKAQGKNIFLTRPRHWQLAKPHVFIFNDYEQ